MNYYQQLEQSLSIVRQRIQSINPIDEYGEVDYSDILNDLYLLERKIIRMLNAHKFLRISKSAFIEKERAGKYVEIEHKVKEYETINDISNKYSVSVSDILAYNNISISNITAGTTLKLLQENIFTPEFIIREDFPVYNELTNENILGQDLPNTLTDNGTGDLLVTTPAETIEQSLINAITTEVGDYPGEADYGLDYRNENGLSDEVYFSMLTIKIANMLLLDPRVKDVTDITITREQNKISVKAKILTVNLSDINVVIQDIERNNVLDESYNVNIDELSNWFEDIQVEDNDTWYSNVYTHTLSQIDIDNKYIILSELANVVDKMGIVVFVENNGLLLEYGVDYSITNDNKILWNGYALDGRLTANDKIKVFY